MLVTPHAFYKKSTTSPKKLGEFLYAKLTKLRGARAQKVEKRWEMNYANYRSSREDLEKVRRSAVTNRLRDWRHRVSSGKHFEVVETLVAYFKGATFPSDDWFTVKGELPELHDQARVVKALANTYLNRAGVRDVYEEAYRSLALYGITTVRTVWHSQMKRKFNLTFDDLGLPQESWSDEETSTLKLQVLDPWDVWLDGSHNVNEGGAFYRLPYTPQEVYAMRSEEYLTISDEVMKAYQASLEGDEPLEVVEYYGPLLHDTTQYWCVHAVFLGKHLVRLADSAYSCGTPYVTATFLKDKDHCYGMSSIDPATSALHTLQVLLNSRLDNLILHIDKMWERVDDGVMDEADVFTEPGKVLSVAQLGNVRPLDMGAQNFTVTYTEGGVQEQAVHGVTAVGPLIGGSQPRGGERVTASEIDAVRAAGGTRLSSTHVHFEDTLVAPFFTKVLALMQQYVVTPQVVAVYDPALDTRAFFEVLPEYLAYPYEFRAVGASYVVESQRFVADVLQLIQVASQNPEMSSQINYGKIIVDLLRQMRFPNPNAYIKATPPTGPTGPGGPGLPGLPEEGGEGLPPEDSLDALGIQNQMSIDGGQGLMESLGAPPQQPTLTLGA